MIKSTKKYCGGCHAVKPRTEFNKRTASKDGLAYRCRTCTKRYAEWFRSKYPLTPEQLALQRAYNAMYRPANRDKINERRKKARAEEKRVMKRRMQHKEKCYV